MTIEEILSMEENQTFDRKSINISPKDLAIPIVAFANADGGDIAIGITDKTTSGTCKSGQYTIHTFFQKS